MLNAIGVKGQQNQYNLCRLKTTRIQFSMLVGYLFSEMSTIELNCKSQKSYKFFSWGNKRDEYSKYDQNCRKLEVGQNVSAQRLRLKNTQTSKNGYSNKFDQNYKNSLTKALVKRTRKWSQAKNLGLLATPFGQALRALALICDNLRSLWSRSNLEASQCKFFTVWPPNAGLFASSTCCYLRLRVTKASPFDQGVTWRPE